MIADDVTEQRSLEEQLRIAQKMEAVGQLAGGVAHDFNNMLTVILGETEEALAADRSEGEVGNALLAIRGAAQRASDVTRRLLAFSRRQVVEPTVFLLDRLVEDSEPMIRRLIEENIRLSTRTVPELWPVRADRSQIEHVLVNLVVNARDAMPQGGTLSIETANVELDPRFCETHPGALPGPYVSLRVRDTGHGMSEETRSHLFEPFFTTKDTGKGTGLGLPMCYGITKQHDGYIDVESAPGHGTTVSVYLPRALESVPDPPRQDRDDRPRGTETILFVEDEAPVRQVGKRILERLGYTVLEADSAEQGLDVLDAHGDRIDMLITDVVLPGMSGRELADRARELRRDLPILFVSGYTDDVMLKQKVLEHGATLLPKPFSLDSLSTSVRDVLDGPTG
jgi:nitrogen-specific signal transduction histidine kinase